MIKYQRILMGLFCLLLLSCSKDEITIFPETCEEHTAVDANIQAIADQYTAAGIPGLAIIYKKKNEEFREVYSGYASLEHKIAIGQCHHFHSASLAKTYFAALTLKLNEQGKIDLESSIADHLTGEFLETLEGFHHVTIRQLLNHTSGIPNFYTGEHILKYFDDFEQQFTHQEMLNFIKGKPLEFETGTDVNYSDSNYFILALILNNLVSNKTHIDLLYEELLLPLDLVDTYYDIAQNSPKASLMVNCYNDYYGDGNLQNVTDTERRFAAMNIGHDSFIAKPTDYFQFFYSLINGDYLSATSLEKMLTFTPYTLDFALHQAEGMGIRKTVNDANDERIGHFGATIGAGNAMLYYPEEEVYLVVCGNFGRFFGGPVAELFTTEFEDLKVEGTLIGDLEKALLEN